MKKALVGLVDYEMGNLNSVSKALEKVGATVIQMDRPEQMKKIDALVLPGVGAFSVAVKNLRKRGLFNPVGEWIARNKPFLGICLGYQLLFEESEEARLFGGQGEKISGFGILQGHVKKFPQKRGLKIPHIGWNQVKKVDSPQSTVNSFNTMDYGLWTMDIFSGIPNGSYFYFVHSYFPVPNDKSIISTTTNYCVQFASSVCDKNLFACQFHPEKSGENGLRLLRNFVRKL